MSGARTDFRERVLLGRTGLCVSRLGIGGSYGLGADALERAYDEYGVNLLYWGSLRRRGFAAGLRRLAWRRRDDLVVVVQSFARLAPLMTSSVNRALAQLGLEHADLLLLGMFNEPPSDRIAEAAARLRESGRVRVLGVSCHRRTTFARYVAEGFFDVLMFRYSAGHRGAERDILPLLGGAERPGAIAYTATRWGSLLDPGRTPPGLPTPRGSDCYRFVLSRPGVDVCLTGPADDGQLREALAALDRGPMDEE